MTIRRGEKRKTRALNQDFKTGAFGFETAISGADGFDVCGIWRFSSAAMASTPQS